MKENSDNSTEYRVIEKVLRIKLSKMGIKNKIRISKYDLKDSASVKIYVKGDINNVMLSNLTKQILNDLLPYVFCNNSFYISSVSISSLK